MLYTEQELSALIELTKEGRTLQQAKEEIYLTYKTDDVVKFISDIKELICDYYNVPSLFPLSRKTRHLIPMVTFAYLIVDRIPSCRGKMIHELFTLYTGRDRCTFLHYVTLYEQGSHLHDTREHLGDCLTNHFFNLKKKITGEDLSIKKLNIIPKIKQTLASERFNRKKDSIIKDIVERFYSYEELNNKYFFMHDHKVVKNFFNREHPEYVGLIRNSYKTQISISLAENRSSFINMITQGCTFNEINREFSIYPRRLKRLKDLMEKREPRIYKMINNYELSKKIIFDNDNINTNN